MMKMLLKIKSMFVKESLKKEVFVEPVLSEENKRIIRNLRNASILFGWDADEAVLDYKKKLIKI